MKGGVGDDPFADEEEEPPNSASTSDPSSSTDTASDTVFVESIVEAIELIERGGENKNISLRDRELKALLLALEENHVERDTLASALDIEGDVPRSAIIRALLRRGLQAEAPEIYEDLATAIGKHARDSM